MSTPLSNLVVSVTGDMSGFSKALNSSKSGLMSWGGSMTSIIAGFVGGSLITGLASKLSNALSLDSIDATAKLSDRLGFTTEQLTGLQHAAGLAGVSNETLTGSLEKMLKNLQEAKGGTGAAAEAMATLGLSATELANTSPDAAFKRISDALAGVPNVSERAALSMAFFGKSGQQLAPLLATGSAGIADAQAEAERLGITFSRVDAAKVEEANDSMTRLGSVFTGVLQRLTVQLAPAIDYVTKGLLHFANASGFTMNWVKSAIDVGVGFWNWMQPFLAQLWTGIVGTWNTIYDAVVPTVTAVWGWAQGRFVEHVTTVIGYGLSLYNFLSSTFGLIYDVVMGIVGPLWDGAVSLWEWGTGSLTTSTEASGNSVTSVLDKLWQFGNWAMQGITKALNIAAFSFQNWRTIVDYAVNSVVLEVVTMWNQTEYVFGTVIPTLLDYLGRNWSDILTDIGTLTKTVFENVAANVISIMSNLPGLISGKVKFGNLWTPLTAGFESSLKELPQIAARQEGDIEKALRQDVEGMKASLGMGLNDYLKQQEKSATDATANILNTFKGLGGSIGDALNTPAVGTPKLPPEAQQDLTDTLDAVDGKGGGAAAAKAIRSGSAESARLQFATPKGIEAIQRQQVKAAEQANVHLTELVDQGKSAPILRIGSFA